MASKIQQDLDYFYKGLLSAQKILDKFSAEFSTKIDNVSQELDSLSSLTAGLRVVEDTPIAALVNGEIDKWQQIINICKGEAEKQVKGREFQDKFEKVPLVIVFGIVKAGKSTLGNFMHGRAFRDAPFDNVYKDGLLPKTKIVVQEKGRQDASEKDAFDENSIESTCSAQYFTFPGLAWVDTPGIGAIEKKRIDIQPLAQIAKRYVQYADLVVFLANSTNPGVQEDIAGYRELYENGKKALVVITRSDTVESKVQDGRVVKVQVPKDKDRRRLQEKSLCDAMVKNGVPSGCCDAVSVSTQLAEKAVAANDDVLWEGGNLGEFYRKIVSVIGNRQILDLKKDAPRKLWNRTVETIVGDATKSDCLARLAADLGEIHVKIQDKYDALAPSGTLVGEIVEDVVGQVRRPIRQYIDRVVSEASGNDVEFSMDALSEEIQSELVDVLGSHVRSIVGDFRKDILGKFSPQGIKSKAERTIETQEYTIEVPEIVERDPDGIFEKICHFFGKKYHTLEVNEETHSFDIDLGIDPTAAKKKLIAQLEKALAVHVKDELAKLRKMFFGESLSKIKKLENNVERLSKKLLSCRF